MQTDWHWSVYGSADSGLESERLAAGNHTGPGTSHLGLIPAATARVTIGYLCRGPSGEPPPEGSARASRRSVHVDWSQILAGHQRQAAQARIDLLRCH